MLGYELDALLQSLPKDYGVKAHELELARYAFEVAETTYERNEAKLILKKLASSEETNKSLMEKKAKYEAMDELFSERLEVLKKKSAYKALECDVDTLDKKIMMTCKIADRIKSDTMQGMQVERSSLA